MAAIFSGRLLSARIRWKLSPEYGFPPQIFRWVTVGPQPGHGANSARMQAH